MKTAEFARPNELLSYERERRHWTQEEVAGQIGAPDAKMIGRWERGITLPIPHYRHTLENLFGKNARELGFVRKGETSFWNVPYRRNPFFTGREDILARLQTSLSTSQATIPQALSGLGGIGKTQTAVEYAYRHADEYHSVLWVQADSAEIIASSFAALGSVLNICSEDEKDQNLTIATVKQWLSVMKYWLLIFDNLNDLSLLHDFLSS